VPLGPNVARRAPRPHGFSRTSPEISPFGQMLPPNFLSIEEGGRSGPVVAPSDFERIIQARGVRDSVSHGALVAANARAPAKWRIHAGRFPRAE
jgi:hypothetical protein